MFLGHKLLIEGLEGKCTKNKDKINTKLQVLN